MDFEKPKPSESTPQEKKENQEESHSNNNHSTENQTEQKRPARRRHMRGPILGHYELAKKTDRNLKDYENELGFQAKELTGMKVLDLGSGYHETFSKEAAMKNIEVFSLNPNLKRQEFRDSAKRNSPNDSVPQKIFNVIKPLHWQKKSVAGLGQELPFRNNSFDRVFANFSVPYYARKTENEYTKIFTEAIRVLKPSGEAVFFPLSQNDFTRHNLEKVLEYIKTMAKVTFERVSVSDRMRLIKL